MSLILRSTKREIIIALTDPHYKSFIDSLKEVDGTLPESVTLPDYVLDQYEAWLRLCLWIELGPCMFYRDHKEENEELRMKSPAVVFLVDVSVFIRTLVDAPEDWERFAAVDDRTPQSERRLHHLAVGRMIRDDWGHEYYGVHRATSLYDDFSMRQDPAKNTSLTSVALREAVLAMEHYTILQGMRHNALLQVIGRRNWETLSDLSSNTTDPDWTLINWGDVIDYAPFDWRLLRSSEPENALTIDLTVPPCVYAYAGRPLRADPEILYGSRILDPLHRTECELVYGIQQDGSFYVLCDKFPLLYDRAIASLMNHGRSLVGYRDLGVLVEEPLVDHSTQYAYRASIYSFLRILTTHVFSGDLSPLQRAEKIASTLGLSTLSLYVTCLIQSNRADLRAFQFISQASLVLEQKGTQGGFISFP